jgi:hypothetical protein
MYKQLDLQQILLLQLYTLFIADVPSGDVINFSFPEDGILFPKGIFTTTLTKITAVTLLTDKYSGPGLTA